MKAVNPTHFTIQIGGFFISSGFADGEFFSAEPESDSVGSVVGTDGEVAVSVMYDKRWTVTLKLLQSADANVLCSELYNLKRQTAKSPLGFFPFLAKHSDTGEYLTATDACFSRPPTISQDRTATTREWKILLCGAQYGFAPITGIAG